MGQIKIVILFLVFIIFSGCAKKASLSGGPKDIIPPVLNVKKSTSNFQTHFYPKTIVLYFDEWITLKNKNQILISPPLNKKPDISYRGKHVKIKFNKEDTLRSNTTYTINFGKSIVDFTEGNPVENFTFIFSTGDKIDSLEIGGKVIGAYDEKPQKDIIVMLYDSEEDSIVTYSKPYYFATTDKNGKFKISHIKPGYFKIFALKDINNNYLFDSEEEQIGFIDTMIPIRDDTINKNIIIKLFKPEPVLRITGKSIVAYGKIRIEYNRMPDSVRIVKSSVPVFEKEIINDSCLIWYDNSNSPDSINIILKNEKKTDTLILKIRKRFENPVSLDLKSKRSGMKPYPDKDLELIFNQPVLLSGTTKGMMIVKDSIYTQTDTLAPEIRDTMLNTIDFTAVKDSLNQRKLKFKGEWKEGTAYILRLLPGYTKSLYGVSNDSISIHFSTGKKEDYSNLTIHLDSLDDKISYLAILKNQKNDIKKLVIENKKTTDIKYTGLVPGSYSLVIIEDTNKNGRWDGGDYFKKTKEEKKYTFSISGLKKNWDQEENIILNSKEQDDIKK